jgi:uncharacterized membrane protein
MGRPLSSLDRFQMVTTVIFIALGLIIIFRSWMLVAVKHQAVSPLAFVFGILLAAYGVYRLRLIRRALERDDRSDRR